MERCEERRRGKRTFAIAQRPNAWQNKEFQRWERRKGKKIKQNLFFSYEKTITFFWGIWKGGLSSVRRNGRNCWEIQKNSPLIFLAIMLHPSPPPPIPLMQLLSPLFPKVRWFWFAKIVRERGLWLMCVSHIRSPAPPLPPKASSAHAHFSFIHSLLPSFGRDRDRYPFFLLGSTWLTAKLAVHVCHSTYNVQDNVHCWWTDL